MRRTILKNKMIVIATIFVATMFIVTSMSPALAEELDSIKQTRRDELREEKSGGNNEYISDIADNAGNDNTKIESSDDSEKLVPSIKQEVSSAIESLEIDEKRNELSGYITISIPESLEKEIKNKIIGTSFSTVSGYVISIISEVISKEGKEKCPLCAEKNNDVFTSASYDLQSLIEGMSEENLAEFTDILTAVAEFGEYYTSINDKAEWKSVNNQLADALGSSLDDYSDQEMKQILTSYSSSFRALANSQEMNVLLNGDISVGDILKSKQSDVRVAGARGEMIKGHTGSDDASSNSLSDCLTDCVDSFLSDAESFLEEHPGVMVAISSAIDAIGFFANIPGSLWSNGYELTAIVVAIIEISTTGSIVTTGLTALGSLLASSRATQIATALAFDQLINTVRSWCGGHCPNSNSNTSSSVSSYVASVSTTSTVSKNSLPL